MIQVVTSNTRKFQEIKNTLLPFESKQISIQLDEIQELDANKILEYKILQASKKVKGDFIVEDSLLYLECLNNKLPGPFIKWFEKTFKLIQIFEICKKLDKYNARAVSMIGFYSNGKIQIFKGETKGVIVEPNGKNDFGYGAIFRPLKSKLTFGQMSREEKYKTSFRAKAVINLKKYLISNKYV